MTSKMPHILKTSELIVKWKVFPVSCAYICPYLHIYRDTHLHFQYLAICTHTVHSFIWH